MANFEIVSKYGWIITENDSHNLKNCVRELEIDLPSDIDFQDPEDHELILDKIRQIVNKLIIWDWAVDYKNGTKIFGISFRDDTFEDFQKNLYAAREDIELLERFFGPARFHEVLSEF